MKKRLIIGIALLALFACAVAYAADFVYGSGSQTTSALIFTGGGKLHGIVVSTDGTNAQTVDIYDGVAASGVKLIPTWVVTTSSTDRTQTIGFYPPVQFGNGIYVNVSGSGSRAYVVYYSR